MSPALRKALRSLLVDIASMQRFPTFPEEFGPFSVYEIDEAGATIEWPNLAITAAEVKRLLDAEG